MALCSHCVLLSFHGLYFFTTSQSLQKTASWEWLLLFSPDSNPLLLIFWAHRGLCVACFISSFKPSIFFKWSHGILSWNSLWQSTAVLVTPRLSTFYFRGCGLIVDPQTRSVKELPDNNRSGWIVVLFLLNVKYHGIWHHSKDLASTSVPTQLMMNLPTQQGCQHTLPRPLYRGRRLKLWSCENQGTHHLWLSSSLCRFYQNAIRFYQKWSACSGGGGDFNEHESKIWHF